MSEISIYNGRIYLKMDKCPSDEDEKLFALEIISDSLTTKKKFWTNKVDESFLWNSLYNPLTEKVKINAYENDVIVETHNVSLQEKNIAFTIPYGIHYGGFGDTFSIMNCLRRFKEVNNCNIFISTGEMNDFFSSITDDFTFIQIIKNDKHQNNNLYLYGDNTAINNIDYHFEVWVEHSDSVVRRTHYYQRWLDFLGIPNEQPLKPTLKEIPPISENIPKPYICFSEFASMPSKMWHYENGWQELVDYFVDKGYTMVSISFENSSLSNIVDLSGDEYSFLHRLSTLKDSEFYIGMDSGLSWMANFIDKHCCLIYGSSEEEFSFQDNVTKIGLSEDDYCRGCLEDVTVLRSWENMATCFYRKSFECTRLLTTEIVITKIEETIL